MALSDLAAEVTVLAELTSTSATNVRNIALGIIGTLTIVVLAARSLGAFADDRYGQLVTLIMAAVPVAGFCYFPDETTALLKGLWQSFVG